MFSDRLILCMTLADAANIPGYRFFGQTKDRQWGKWAPDDRPFSEDDRQQWTEERRRRLAEEDRRNAEAMPAIERDQHYRHLLQQLELAPTDRTELEQRFEQANLPQSQWHELIQNWGIKSISQWQKLDFELPHSLPGVNVDGRSLVNFGAGYLCPVRDVDGAIVAFQIRHRAGDTRYTWLSQSATEKQVWQRFVIQNYTNRCHT